MPRAFPSHPVKFHHILLPVAFSALLCACASRPGIRPAPADPNTVGIPVKSASRSGFKDTFIVSELDEPLRQIDFVKPNYPGHLWAKKRGGQAVVEFIVLTDGSVGDVIVTSATHEDFGASAASAISQWRFAPPIKDGRPVAVRARQLVPFNLR